MSDYCTTLSKHEVVENAADSGARGRVRIERESINMIAALDVHDQIMGKWRRMDVGTVIFPQQKGFQVQGVSMQSMTEQDLKIEFTFDVKPIELVISTV